MERDQNRRDATCQGTWYLHKLEFLSLVTKRKDGIPGSPGELETCSCQPPRSSIVGHHLWKFTSQRPIHEIGNRGEKVSLLRLFVRCTYESLKGYSNSSSMGATIVQISTSKINIKRRRD